MRKTVKAEGVGFRQWGLWEEEEGRAGGGLCLMVLLVVVVVRMGFVGRKNGRGR